MKKIKSIKQLRLEQVLINQRLEELEFKMQDQWYMLKQGFTPAAMIKNTLGAIIKTGAETLLNKESLLKTTLKYGAAFLAARLVKKTVQQSGKITALKQAAD